MVLKKRKKIKGSVAGASSRGRKLALKRRGVDDGDVEMSDGNKDRYDFNEYF